MKRHNRRGATLVEFAVVASVFLLVAFGVIELGLVYWRQSLVTGAARVGTRYAIVRGTTSGRVTDTAAVGAFVRSQTSLSPITVTTTWPTSKDPGEFVDVTVEYYHKLATSALAPLVPDSVRLRSKSQMVIVF